MTVKKLALMLLSVGAAGCGLDVNGTYTSADAEQRPEEVDAWDGSEFRPDQDIDEAEGEFECLEDIDCSDGDPCNGIETCDPAARTCTAGTGLEDGYVCGAGEPRKICLGEACVESRCGDGFVDGGTGESCEPPGAENCSAGCRVICDGDEDCPDDGNVCNGDEYCDLGSGECDSRNPPEDGTACGTGPGEICISGTCQESRCGDGFVDAGAGEECDDGNDAEGDGCEPVTCLYSCHDYTECDDGHGCTDDICEADTHTCSHPLTSGGTPCRPAAGICDVEEVCSGDSAYCPADGYLPVTAECRAASGDCDAPEYCPGTSPDCPGDGFRPEGTACDDGDPCTYPDECDGSGACAGTPSGLHDVAAVSAGAEHTCALMSAGGVKCWGRNDKGQLGNGSIGGQVNAPGDVSGLAPGVSAISSGDKHVCALFGGGEAACWGLNDKGQLGDGTTADSAAPVDVSGLPPGVSAVSAGGKHTCALMSTGRAKCWGLNDKGQLGDGATTDSSTPVDVLDSPGGSPLAGIAALSSGGSHTCALMSGGGVKCWGGNGSGQLGDGTTADSASPVDVSGPPAGTSAISAGGGHTCVLTSAGDAACWGLNGSGQLGDGTTTDSTAPVDVTGLSTGASAISSGTDHTCAPAGAGGLQCWGSNANGRLGDGTNSNCSTPVDVLEGPGGDPLGGVSAVSAGDKHTCALMDTGGVKCWGRNNRGQLGDGTTVESWSPVDVVCP